SARRFWASTRRRYCARCSAIRRRRSPRSRRRARSPRARRRTPRRHDLRWCRRSEVPAAPAASSFQELRIEGGTGNIRKIPMRIVVHGQQAFGKAVLEALLKRGENVIGVYVAPEKPGQKADPLKEAALAAGLPVHQPESYRKPEVWE